MEETMPLRISQLLFAFAIFLLTTSSHVNALTICQINRDDSYDGKTVSLRARLTGLKHIRKYDSYSVILQDSCWVFGDMSFLPNCSVDQVVDATGEVEFGMPEMWIFNIKRMTCG